MTQEMTQDPSLPPLALDAVEVAYGPRTVVPRLGLAVAPGTWVALVGPNGSGKSTVLRAMARLVAPRAGRVLLDGVDMARIPAKEVARRLAVLPQGPQPPGGITVRELVEQGRHPHRRVVGPPSATDREAVRESLELTGTLDLADRYAETLSGGERQRVWIALALAQQTQVLLLDEPTTFLDVRHQLEVLDLVASLRLRRRLTVVTVLHDLGHAGRYADRVVALRDGRVMADGTPEEVVTAEVVARVFGVRATVLPDPVTGTPVVLPHATTAAEVVR